MPRFFAAGTCLGWFLLAASALGLERGAPWQRHVIDGSSNGADGVRLADVNGDRLPDITTGWEQGGCVRVYLNPGAARSKKPWPAVTVGNAGSPEDAVFGDLDGDGAIDVVSSCEGSTKSLFMHWAPAEKSNYADPRAWSTQAIPAAKGAKSWMYSFPVQLDSRHGIDLVAGSKGNDAEIGWFEAPANPRDLTAWAWHPICKAGWVMSLYAIDMDRDGDLDVVTSDRHGADSGCRWLENPGTLEAQRKPWKSHAIGATGQDAMFMVMADLDGDGLLDAISAVKNHGIAYMRRMSDQPPTWQSHAIPWPADTGNEKAVQAGDIDLDGRLDLVASCAGAEGKTGVFWLSCDKANSPASSSWLDHEISGKGAGVKFDRIELLDLDADGDLDVLTCEERDNLGVIWYENPARTAAAGGQSNGQLLPQVGERFVPSDVDLANPIYETSFEDPSALKDWRLEGGNSKSVAEGSLVLTSEPGPAGEKSKDHLVCWLDRAIPADFLLEFSVRPTDRRKGLNIVFFCARGVNGQGVFDAALRPRDGTYSQYNQGDINAYHISYWAAGRETANLRKSKGFHLVAEGKDLVYPAASDAFQTIRVYKRGDEIRMMVDDVVALAWRDDGRKYGPVLESGWIGLRQMGSTEKCAYGHVKVCRLRP